MISTWSSIHFAGMENPVTTYVTPTLLAGDRSLDRVICHEVSETDFCRAATATCSTASRAMPCVIQQGSVHRRQAEKLLDQLTDQ